MRTDKLYTTIITPEARSRDEEIISGFMNNHDEPEVKKTHYFNNRYENIYIESSKIRGLDDLLSEAIQFAEKVSEERGLRAGFWFNYMPPGSSTTLHSHDDFDEVISAVYYLNVPENSGRLLLHDVDSIVDITPKEHMYIFFDPRLKHEVTENLSDQNRLSIGFNFGKNTIYDI